MKLINRRWSGGLGLFLAVLAGGVLLTQGIGHGQVQVTIQGFQQGTSLHTRAETIGELIRKFVGYGVTVKTGVGMSSAIDSTTGKIDMFISLRPYNLTVEMLQKDVPAIAKKYKETIIIPTEEKSYHLMVLDEVKVSSFSEMVTKKYPIKIGLGGAGSAVFAEKIFNVYGISSRDIESWGGKVDATSTPISIVNNMKDGILNAHFVYGGGGSAYLQELAATRKSKLLPVADTDSELKAVQKQFPEVYRSFLTPKDYAFLKQDLATIAFSEFLMARPDLPEEVVYNITKAIWTNVSYLLTLCPGMKDILEPQRAMRVLSIRRDDIHPGAVKYYKERTWLK